ncbi:MAG: enoyl-CoA hydratase [Pseudomonadota bacterium]
MTDTSPILLTALADRVATLTLNRPEARNSLSLEMLHQLKSAIDGLGQDPGVRAIVLAGAGPAFCAGHDLKEMTAARQDADGGRAFFLTTMTACSAMMQAVVHCPKPVIAAVHGIATAAGCQLVASCDLAVAAQNSRFATPGVNIGLFCSTPMVALSRNVGRKRAMKMLLTGQMIDAATAADWGLVSDVVAPGAVLAEAQDQARQIAEKSGATLRIGKTAFYTQAEMGLAEAYAYATRVMVDNMMIDDAREGIGAFLEKRAPVWSGDAP